MASSILSPRRLLFGLLLLAGLYGWWVASQYQQLNALNQRELADAALELKSSIDTAFENISRYEPTGDGFPACEFDVDQLFLSIDDCNKEWTEWLKPRLLLTGGLQVQAERGFERETEEDARKAALRRVPKPKALAEKGRLVTFRFSTEALLAASPFTGRFDRIFLVDGNGKVIYQEDPRLPQRLRLLRWGERGFRDAKAAQSHGPGVQSIAELLGKDAAPGWSRLKAVSDRTTVQLGGARLQLYTHPVTSDEGATLILVGVVPAADLLRQALAFDTYLSALLVFLALFGLLGFPFIKLATLDPHERFRMRDVKWLYVSCSALLVVLTFAVLAADSYQRWKTVADDGLEKLAAGIGDQLMLEIEDLTATLQRHDQAVAALRPGPKCDPNLSIVTGWFDNPAEPQRLGFPIDEHIYLDQAAWVSPAGQQVWKVTSDRIGSKANVVRRPYYRAVRDGNLFEMPSGPKGFFIGPDWSVTDGKFYTFISMRSQLTDQRCLDADAESDGPGSPDPYMVVGTARLMSVDRVPLPVGYGFAVLNREGRVLYHSDRRLSLRENFFDQLTDGVAARGAVYAGYSGPMASRYRETPHRIYLHKLPLARQERLAWPSGLTPDPAGLYVAAFRDVSIEQAVVSRAFLVGLLGPFLYLLAVIVAGIWATGWVAARVAPGRDHWLWPHGTFVPVYQRQAIVYGALLVASLALSQTGAGVWAYVALPPLAIAGGLIVYARDSHHRVPRCALTRPRWHLLQFSLLGLGLVLVPASAMFDATIRHEFGTLVDTEQRWLADQIEDIRPEMEADARFEGIPVRVGTRAAAQRRSRLGSWPEPFDAPYEPIEGATLRLVGIHEWLDQLVPFESDRVARLRYQNSTSQYKPAGLWGAPVGWVGAVGLALLGLALVGWLRWSSTRLLYADVQSLPELHPQLAAAAWDACTLDEKHVTMHILDEGIVNPRQRPVVLGLMRKGLVRLSPDLQLSSPQLVALVRSAQRSQTMSGALRDWEHRHDGRNWHDTRAMLIVGLVVITVLVATQPGLPQELAAVASGVAAIGGAGLKVKELFAAWLQKGGKA